VQKWVGGFLPFYLFTFLPFFAACSHIEEDEQLIYVKPAQAERRVLLEDFTGQRCVNCPSGTAVIEQLLQEYGDAVIAVGIHGGPLGFKGNANTLGLATSVGDEYYNHWQLEYQPVGLVDRHGAVNYTDWTFAVKEELTRPAPMKMEGEADIKGDKVDIRLKMQSTEGTITGKLQIWLLEDGIKAMQLMPDGTADSEYVHNHVLRTPVNGTWGEDITLQEAENKNTHHTQTLDPKWNPEQLSIVAFVYNDQGVQQVVKVKVKNKKV
jgi:hypothetical protein